MTADMTINIRCTDLKPVKRLIDAIADVALGARRDGYESPELTVLHDAIAEIRATPAPVPPSPRLTLGLDGRPAWVPFGGYATDAGRVALSPQFRGGEAE